MERFAKRHTFRVYKSPETLYNKKKTATPCRPPLPIHLIPIIASQAIRATFKQHLCDLQCQNLGFTNLYQPAYELTEVLRAGTLEGSKEWFDRVTEQYNITINAIRAVQ